MVPVFGPFGFVAFYLCPSVISEAEPCKTGCQGPLPAGLQLAARSERNWQDAGGQDGEKLGVSAFGIFPEPGQLLFGFHQVTLTPVFTLFVSVARGHRMSAWGPNSALCLSPRLKLCWTQWVCAPSRADSRSVGALGRTPRGLQASVLPLQTLAGGAALPCPA